MTILDTIVEYKIKEVEIAKNALSIEKLKEEKFFSRTPYLLKDFFNKSKNGIIAEFKRASPSKGIINNQHSVSEITKAYEKEGVSAISVLTDTPSFKGSLKDLIEARMSVEIPLLRKEFIIDAYQIYEAKAFGADIILLIAAILTPKQVGEFAKIAKDLGLSVILEVHTLEELENNKVQNLDAIGVNNRNLHDFSVSIENSLQLVSHIPESHIKISESGITDAGTIEILKKNGFQGFLIGENFMRTSDPAKAIQNFTHELSLKN